MDQAGRPNPPRSRPSAAALAEHRPRRAQRALLERRMLARVVLDPEVFGERRGVLRRQRVGRQSPEAAVARKSPERQYPGYTRQPPVQGAQEVREVVESCRGVRKLGRERTCGISSCGAPTLRAIASTLCRAGRGLPQRRGQSRSAAARGGHCIS